MDKIAFMDHVIMTRKWIHHKKEICAFPYLSFEKIREYQLKRIKQIVDDSIKYVPYYREIYTKLGINANDIKTFRDFEKIPTISKQDLIGEEDRFIDERYRNKRLIKSKTSGTSGVFVDIFCDSNMFIEEELQVLRMLKELHPDYNCMSKEVLVYTSEYPVSSMLGLYPTYYINNLEKAETIAQKIRKIRPEIIAIYPSILREIVSTQAIDFSSLGIKLILTNSENSSQDERNHWAGLFNCCVKDEFSSEEIQSIAYQCNNNNYHEVSDCSYIELLNEETDLPVEEGSIGEITGTCLINRAMPLIRYRQGDFAKRINHACTCGKCTPLIGTPMGRRNSSFKTKDGTIIPSGKLLDWSYSLVLKFKFSIQEFQIVQETHKIVNINLIAPFLKAYDIQIIKDDFIKTFGSLFCVNINLVNYIPKSESGKHIPIISKVI